MILKAMLKMLYLDVEIKTLWWNFQGKCSVKESLKLFWFVFGQCCIQKTKIVCYIIFERRTFKMFHRQRLDNYSFNMYMYVKLILNEIKNSNHQFFTYIKPMILFPIGILKYFTRSNTFLYNESFPGICCGIPNGTFLPLLVVVMQELELACIWLDMMIRAF